MSACRLPVLGVGLLYQLFTGTKAKNKCRSSAKLGLGVWHSVTKGDVVIWIWSTRYLMSDSHILSFCIYTHYN